LVVSRAEAGVIAHQAASQGGGRDKCGSRGSTPCGSSLQYHRGYNITGLISRRTRGGIFTGAVDSMQKASWFFARGTRLQANPNDRIGHDATPKLHSTTSCRLP
jgi:hypothetical protein